MTIVLSIFSNIVTTLPCEMQKSTR